MPAGQSLGFDNHESTLPVAQSGPQHQTQSRRIGQRLRSDLVFSVERQLLAQEQVLRDQRGARSERRFQEGNEVRTERGNKGRDCGSRISWCKNHFPCSWCRWTSSSCKRLTSFCVAQVHTPK